VGSVFAVLVATIVFDVVRLGGQGLAADHLPHEQVPPAP
jgi:hypothetical protein